MTRDSDTSSHTLSHPVIRDSVTHNDIYDTDLWDGDHHVTSLSGCDMHLEANAKVLATSLKRLACFIQKRPLKSHPIEQFPSVLGIGSYVWRLLQAVSEAGWDRFKISPQSDAPTLVEAMRTVYGPVPVPTPSPDVEMAVDAPEAEEVAFTLVTNKKHKGKGKVPSPLSGTPSNSRSKTSLVSRALPLPKAVITRPVTTTSKTIQAQMAPPPVPLASKPKPKAWDGVSMSTNSVTSAAELEVIKQWLKKTAGLGESTEVEPRLPQSKSFLKILGVPYWDSKSSLLITPAQVEAALSNSPLFEGVTLASMPCIMKASPSSDMSVIWIDIWDSQKGSKGKTLINRSFNFERHTATV